MITQLTDAHLGSDKQVHADLLEAVIGRADDIENENQDHLKNVDAVLRMLGRANFIRTVKTYN